jgi:hypothetical protein
MHIGGGGRNEPSQDAAVKSGCSRGGRSITNSLLEPRECPYLQSLVCARL